MSLMLDLGDARAVIFDLDGTLYNKSRLPLRLVMSDLPHMAMLGHERKARKELMGHWFGDEQAYYDTLYARVAELSHTSPSRAIHWYEQRYMPNMQRILRRHYQLEPWVEGMLSDLRQRGIKTAVYSDYGCLRERLEALGFDCSWVDVVADAPALGGLKPCRQSTEKLCALLGVSPSETLMVGDRDDTDGESARRCGMRFQQVDLHNAQ